MDTHDEPIRPTRPLLETLDPTRLWVLGLGIDEAGDVIGPGQRQFSFWAECECPDACNRDHANE